MWPYAITILGLLLTVAALPRSTLSETMVSPLEHVPGLDPATDFEEIVRSAITDHPAIIFAMGHRQALVQVSAPLPQTQPDNLFLYQASLIFGRSILGQFMKLMQADLSDRSGMAFQMGKSFG
jgi:hypothetical protein